MDVTPTQAEILAALAGALEKSDEPVVVYRTAWWGYIPDPVASYVEVDGVDLSPGFPPGWLWRDLDALAQAGFLRKAGEWENPEDEDDRRVLYEPVGR